MMNNKINLKDISIRTELQPGDMGYIIYLHGLLYSKEYNFGIQFEDYVAKGLIEFKEKYDPKRNRLWVCEYKQSSPVDKRSSPVDKQSSPVDNERMIGFLLLMDRGESAQLRYFLIAPAYRGIGLGSKLMNLYMDFLHECGYKNSYLWTTSELHSAISLYKRFGFQLTEEKESAAFGKLVTEQRYDLALP